MRRGFANGSAALALGALALAACSEAPTDSYDGVPVSTEMAAPAPPSPPPPPPPPGPVVEQATGVIARAGGRPMAGFQLITSGGYDYYLKLVDVSSGTEVLTAFVHGGEPFETDVPLGQYELRYATGEVWYGPEHLFGRETGYSKADEILNFYVEGNTINGVSIELVPQLGGTLETVPIDAAAF